MFIIHYLTRNSIIKVRVPIILKTLIREVYEFSCIFSDSFDFTEILRFAEIFNENFRFINSNKNGNEVKLTANTSCNRQQSNQLNGACNIIDVSGEIAIQNKINFFENSIFRNQAPAQNLFRSDESLISPSFPSANSYPSESLFQLTGQKPFKCLPFSPLPTMITKGYSSSIFSVPNLNSDQSSKATQIEPIEEDLQAKLQDNQMSSDYCLDMKIVYSLILERCKRVTYAENCRNENCKCAKLPSKNRDPTADKEFISESSFKQNVCSLSTSLYNIKSEQSSMLQSTSKKEKLEILIGNTPNDINELIEFINSETCQTKKDEQLKKKDKKKKKKNATANEITTDKFQAVSKESLRDASQSDLVKQQSSQTQKSSQGNSFPASILNKYSSEEDKDVEAFRASIKSMSVHSAFVYKLKTSLMKETFKYICLIH